MVVGTHVFTAVGKDAEGNAIEGDSAVIAVIK
jgi:hypothetical protein